VRRTPKSNCSGVHESPHDERSSSYSNEAVLVRSRSSDVFLLLFVSVSPLTSMPGPIGWDRCRGQT